MDTLGFVWLVLAAFFGNGLFWVLKSILSKVWLQDRK